MHIVHFLNLYGADMRLISCRWVTYEYIELVERVTIDIVGRVASQRMRPSPQAQSYLLESCPVSK